MQSLLQKGPKFAVSSSRVPLTKYIAVTKRICDELGENTTGKDCTEIYQKTKEILHCYKKKKSFTQNTTKEEREAIKTLREDASRVVLTADKGVALVVMDKSQYVINVWHFSMTLKSTNLAKTLPKNCTEMSRKPLDSSTEIMDLPDYIGGAKSITPNCSPQVTHPLHLDSTVCLKSTRLIAPCDP